MLRRVVALALVGLALVLPTTASAQGYKVLVATSTEDELSAAGIAAIQAVASSGGFTVTAPSPAAVGGEFTPANLAQYDAVIFLNTTGDLLTDAQQEAFEEYYTEGGGFFGIGSAIETEPGWQFLTDVLGTRATGKAEVQSGTIKVADRVHDASKDLPEYWDRTDAWYSFSSNVRGLSHVLATVVELVDDRGAFEIQPSGERLDGVTGGTMGVDHPVTWCKDFRGGRSFYTALGNTAARFCGTDFRSHLAGAIKWAAGDSDPVYSDCGATVLANYQQTKVSGPPNLSEPIAFDLLPDGRVIQTDRRGGIRLHDPTTNSTTLLAEVPVYTVNEDGMYGPAIDNDFATNRWVYLFYSPPTVKDVKLSTARSSRRRPRPARRPTPARRTRRGIPTSATSSSRASSSSTPRERRPRAWIWRASRRSCACPTTAAPAATWPATSTSTSTTTCGWSRVTTRRRAAVTRAASGRSTT